MFAYWVEFARKIDNFAGKTFYWWKSNEPVGGRAWRTSCNLFAKATFSFHFIQDSLKSRARTSLYNRSNYLFKAFEQPTIPNAKLQKPFFLFIKFITSFIIKFLFAIRCKSIIIIALLYFYQTISNYVLKTFSSIMKSRRKKIATSFTKLVGALLSFLLLY